MPTARRPTCCLVYNSVEFAMFEKCLYSHNTTPHLPLPSYHAHLPQWPFYHIFVSTHVLGLVYNQSFPSPYPTYISRNPEHNTRPTFEDITMGLARDPVVLLSWSQQDKATSSKAAVLGAPLEEGRHLYKKLQNKYQ